MNPKVSFYALMSGFALVIAVVSAAPVKAAQVNSQQTIEERVTNVRKVLELQNNQANPEQQPSEDKNLIGQWDNSWSNINWYNLGWYNTQAWKNTSGNWNNTVWDNWRNVWSNT